MWSDFTTDGNGGFSSKEAKEFVKVVLTNMYGEYKFNLARFTSWFNHFDNIKSGQIEKSEFVQFITKLTKTEMFGHRDLSGH